MDNLPSTSAPESEKNPPLKDPVKTKIETAYQETSKLQHDASQQAAASFESAKSNLSDIAKGAVEYSRSALTEQKEKLAEIIQQYSQSAKTASESLHQEQHLALAQRAEEISSQFDRAANYLRKKELSEIYSDAEHFTRQRPELVFGMMFAAGLMAARFLKASKHSPQGPSMSNARHGAYLPQPQVSPPTAMTS
jgi:hypothetical protein